MSDIFDVTVYRQYISQECTSGYLAVNGTITCYTLERPWADNAENISSIPASIYNGFLRYDHDDHWRIELVDVPDRTNVQIHVGNEPDETKGCILVGESLGEDLCSLKGSVIAYGQLKAAFYGTDDPISTPDKTIVVTIEDAG